MKKKALSFHYITLAIICQVFLCFTPVSAASNNTNDFYFKNFTADYYLSKDEEDISHLEVVENLTAVFPNFDQNHGITREIPFTNQDGKNVTIKNLRLSVTRNGEPERFRIEKESNYFLVYIGDSSEYVHGEQNYTLTYDFEKVITDFDNYQELYWDTNGTGWSQRFNSLTAAIHLDNNVKDSWNGESWCYVGGQGSNDQSRCTTEKTEDGVKFTTKNLSSGENLTFDVQFKPNSFTVPEPEKNYSLIILFSVNVIVILLVIFLLIKDYFRLKPKIAIYKDFIKPEYTPLKNLSVAEMAELSLKSVKSSKVAILLDLAIRGKIELVKGEKKIFGGHGWSINLKDLSGLSSSESATLKIFNSGKDILQGETIEIKSQNYSASLYSLSKTFDSDIKSSLEEKGYFEQKNKFVVNKATLIIGIWFFCYILAFIFIMSEALTASLVGGLYIIPITFFINFILTFLVIIISSKLSEYSKRTTKGLEAARYLEGLKLYIKMAEADRLKFLQSVEGADTSHNGIVKLYEKLLPYAVLFGLEESWMKELNRYYQLDDVSRPTWYLGTNYLLVSDLHSFTTSANSSVSSSSSSSSGSGGGGFSGGGGGGGGGGGW